MPSDAVRPTTTRLTSPPGRLSSARDREAGDDDPDRCCGGWIGAVSAQSTDDALVAALARASVERAAPEELPLFRATSEAYFDDPASLERQRSGDEMLGFGVDAAVMLVTPVALAVAKDVIEFIGTQLRARAEKEGEGAIDRVLNRLLRRRRGARRRLRRRARGG